MFFSHLLIYGSELANFHMNLATPAHVYNIEWLCIVGPILMQFYWIEDHVTPTVVTALSPELQIFNAICLTFNYRLIRFFFVFFPKLWNLVLMKNSYNP